MKRLLTIALVLFPLLMVAQDDLYFTPAKKKQTPKEERKEQNEYKRSAFADYGVSKRSDDEYNRRYSFSGDRQNAGGLYADESDTLLTARIDSVPAYDMDDPEIDYRYSRRLVRFHSPRYYSPYYWDLMYAYGAWDYLYDPWDPWYWHYGWGYGWTWGPWDCWYGGIWGWHHPYHWSYWGWGWHWGAPVFTTTIGSSFNYRPRGSYVTTSHNGRGGTISRHRTNPAELRRGNVADVRSSGMRGSGLTARGSGMSGRQTSARTSTVRGNSSYGSARTSTARSGRTDYTGGRMTANRYGQRGAAASGSSASRSYNNASSSSRSYTPSSSSSSRSSGSYSRSSSSYSSGSSSFGSSRSGGSFSSGSSGGGGSFSGGGGGSRGGGGGGRR